MSELTRCNHCTLESIKRREGAAVKVVRGETFWVVYVGDKAVAWLVALTEKCCC
jgi:endonuclease YncB( thermonuclease family)